MARNPEPSGRKAEARKKKTPTPGKASDRADSPARRAAELPDAPGVYFFRDRRGRIIYIGKAISLRNRVRSYFRVPAPGPDGLKTARLAGETADIGHLETAGEAEAFFLESRLIKYYQPRYNIERRDDKTFPWLRLTREDWPRAGIVRERRLPDAWYFGPFTDSGALQRAWRRLRQVFPLASCRRRFRPERPDRPCLEHDLGRCLAPCAGKVSPEDYQRVARALLAFLRGRSTASLLREMKESMIRAAGEMRFEEAARLRDEIRAIRSVLSHPGFPEGEWPESREKPDLAEAFGLAAEPVRVEGYDISNLFGREAVGSLVVFVGGAPSRKDYRRFRVEGFEGADDCAMLARVLERRTGEQDWPRPELVLVDGGRGQVEAAARVLREAGWKAAVLGLAKKEESVFRPGLASPLPLPPSSPEVLFLRRVRDEAHRFALAYHRSLRRREVSRSVLDEVPGIGPARKKKLLSLYASPRDIARAPDEELARAGIPPKVIAGLRRRLGRE